MANKLEEKELRAKLYELIEKGFSLSGNEPDLLEKATQLKELALNLINVRYNPHLLGFSEKSLENFQDIIWRPCNDGGEMVITIVNGLYSLTSAPSRQPKLCDAINKLAHGLNNENYEKRREYFEQKRKEDIKSINETSYPTSSHRGEKREERQGDASINR